ncbi:MAG TPA: hypothetical protein DCX77_00925 [Acidimicrobiaceae bacterium]|nr:hypothetical protein [Acidimicrobiaceae bacterium]
MGQINLLGHRSRPWLQIVRPETEKVYLNHQLKQMRLAHAGPLEYVWDVLPTDGFYDKKRLRVRSDELHRAYELMYPRDKKIITPQVMSICGIYGLTALWSDRGRVVGRLGKIRTRLSTEDNHVIANWCNDNGFSCSLISREDKCFGIQFDRDSTQNLIASIRPHIHKTMRKTFTRVPAVT